MKDVIIDIQEKNVPDWTIRYEGTEPWTVVVNEFNTLMQADKMEEARQLLEIEYAGGNEAAGIKLALCLKNGWFGYKEPERAVCLLKSIAQKGNACAMSNLAYCYHYGEGVRQSNRWAFYWFLRAADMGDANAQLALGVELTVGDYLPKNSEDAEELLDMSAKQGEPEAVYMLGFLKYRQKDFSSAADYFQCAIKMESSPFAELYLGRIYHKGLGVEPNFKKAKSLLKRALKRGLPQRFLNKEEREFIGGKKC